MRIRAYGRMLSQFFGSSSMFPPGDAFACDTPARCSVALRNRTVWTRGPMDPSQKETLDIFTRTRALLTGHFVLRSGLHSGHYFQCAQVCQHMDAVERLGELLLARVRAAGWDFATVLAPAMGGLVIGQEFARQARARYIFAEKENNALVLRRGFTFAAGERVLVVEDVVTR